MRHSRNLRRCERCDKRIPPERLRLVPETRRCVHCSDTHKVTDADVDCDGAPAPDDAADSAHGAVDRGGDWS